VAFQPCYETHLLYWEATIDATGKESLNPELTEQRRKAKQQKQQQTANKKKAKKANKLKI